MPDILADSRMLPGDFLLRQFNDDPLLQLCCTGMKIYSVQKYMVESFHRCGGQDLRESTVKIVHWLLDTFCNTPRDHVADSAHGDIGHACGPTSFMTQSRIITSCPPWHGAPALVSPTEQKYFQTTTPTAVLDSLRAALVGYPRPLVKLGEALATQSEVSRLLSTHMPGMNENYTAPQVSKTHSCLAHCRQLRRLRRSMR